MKKYQWHILIWILYTIYFLIDVKEFKDILDPVNIRLSISYNLSAIVSFYAAYFFAWKPYFERNSKWHLLLVVPVSLMLFVLCRFFFEEVVYESVFGFGNYANDNLWFYTKANMSRAIFYLSMSLIVVLFENRNSDQAKFELLQKEKSKAEMDFLRSQLNPHFLFNTLSFVHTKTIKHDPELADSVLKLSDMLRYSLESSKQDKVPLYKEIDLIENYTNIFQKRFEGKFFVDMRINGQNRNQAIEPLLLMPFVENAYKHGVVNDSNDPVKIVLDWNQDSLSFSTFNKVNHYQKDKGSGIGLENVKRRLDLLYQGNYSLDIKEKDGYFSVALHLTWK